MWGAKTLNGGSSLGRRLWSGKNPILTAFNFTLIISPKRSINVIHGLDDFIYYLRIYAYKPFCGGPLLSSDTVLTAAHCNEKWKLDFSVKLGLHHVYQNDDRTITVKPIKWIQHPDYNNLDNDFAIIKLRENVEFVAGRVGPACLPDPATSYDDVDATVTGWGLKKHNGEQANILQKVSESVTST